MEANNRMTILLAVIVVLLLGIIIEGYLTFSLVGRTYRMVGIIPAISVQPAASLTPTPSATASATPSAVLKTKVKTILPSTVVLPQ